MDRKAKVVNLPPCLDVGRKSALTAEEDVTDAHRFAERARSLGGCRLLPFSLSAVRTEIFNLTATLLVPDAQKLNMNPLVSKQEPKKTFKDLI